ncbi:MAG: glycoside hydrolase family 31 protein [Gammaproteobacteria bacterium]|nr:glycoside hydrolase family 31 protein [Gammaproteobacteria bacterium]
MQLKFNISLIMYLTLSFYSSLLAAAELQAGDVTLTVNKQSVQIKKSRRLIINLEKILVNYTEASDWKISSVDDKQILIRASFPSKIEFFKHVDDSEPRTAELVISKTDSGFRIYANPTWGLQTTLHFNYLDDHFFGLSAPLQPDNQRSPDLTGSSIEIDIDSRGEDLQENYASAYSSFFISSFGYGAFFDTFARGRYDFAINGKNKIHHDTGKLDWYLFFGDNGTEIHKAYFEVVAQPKHVPVWAVGPVGWRDENKGGAAEILADIKHMNELRIPFTSWFVDRPYSDGAHNWSKMNFSKPFANPEKWIKTIRENHGLEFMTWSAATTFGDARFEKHFAGDYSYLDLSHPASVRAFQNDLQQKQYVYGVKGHKIDRADQHFPLYADWFDKSVGPNKRRNKYVYLSAKIHDEALRKTWGDDQFTFARAAIQRVQPYLSAVWGGDPRSSWEGLQSNFANGMRSSFMGFPVWGSDVGGYLGEGRIPKDLYIRWLQAGSMSGLFEIKLDGAGGEGRDRLPWNYDKELQNAFRVACEDRMRWIPYLYSLINTSATNGAVMQPMAYQHLKDKNTYSIWDQFYVGDAVLVAPVFEPGTKRTVYFPKGNWRDLDKPGKRYKGERTYEIEAPLPKLPRFVKDNSIYVTGSIYHGNDKLWKKSDKMLIIHATPGQSKSRTHFDYVDMLDANTVKTITMKKEKSTVTINIPMIIGLETVHVALDKKPSGVFLDNESIESAYDADLAILSVSIKSDKQIELTIKQ